MASNKPLTLSSSQLSQSSTSSQSCLSLQRGGADGSALASKGRRSWEESVAKGVKRGGGRRQGTLDSYTAKKSSAGRGKSGGKKATKVGGGGAGSSTDASSSMLLVDKHAPTNSSDLCVAPKKVKEVRSWIEAALPASAGGRGGR